MIINVYLLSNEILMERFSCIMLKPEYEKILNLRELVRRHKYNVDIYISFRVKT